MTLEQINTALYKKLHEEQQEFIESLKNSTPEKVIQYAYELVIREDILLSLEENDLDARQCKALLREKKLLDKLFLAWEKHEGDHMNEIRECIENKANDLIKLATGMFAWPFEATQTITSYFGTRTDPFTGETKTHSGIDIAAPMGTPVLASADGIVVSAGYDEGGYGYYIKIKHSDTYTTVYGHCSALFVSVGDEVKQGQVIADCGSTGKSTGPHCHFELLKNGVRIDGLSVFKKIKMSAN